MKALYSFALTLCLISAELPMSAMLTRLPLYKIKPRVTTLPMSPRTQAFITNLRKDAIKAGNANITKKLMQAMRAYTQNNQDQDLIDFVCHELAPYINVNDSSIIENQKEYPILWKKIAYGNSRLAAMTHVQRKPTPLLSSDNEEETTSDDEYLSLEEVSASDGEYDSTGISSDERSLQAAKLPGHDNDMKIISKALAYKKHTNLLFGNHSTQETNTLTRTAKNLQRKSSIIDTRTQSDSEESSSSDDQIYFDDTFTKGHNDTSSEPSTLSEFLFEAIKEGNYHLTQSLLEDNPELISARGANGNTLFHTAAQSNKPEIIPIIAYFVAQAIKKDCFKYYDEICPHPHTPNKNGISPSQFAFTFDINNELIATNYNLLEQLLVAVDIIENAKPQ